ncbi:MAG: AraC family transcriptional regulator [Alphaproteobacteria bacterium]|nr:AraC family transcriptional regulator [Alphaproteobacteria bacterium]MBU0875885.1 AraC family transcriptional regulator [Alphaproteobacteria bacterium]MBU1769934.1 AraC family transcriptional regulator [Alphaproteobacteria bacterium]
MAEPTIAAHFLRHVAHCLELTGRPADPLLQAIGIERASLEDPQQLLLLADFIRFFEAAADYVNNLHFGLYVGRLAASDSLGPLSFLFLSAPTLREAFSSFTRYLETMQQGSRHRFEEHAHLATFEYGVTHPNVSQCRQDTEYSIGATYTLARQFVGGQFSLVEVRFEHEIIGDYARYRDYFGCDVFFSQDRNSISFDVDLLNFSSQALSPTLYPILEEHLRRKAEAFLGQDTMAERVRGLIDSKPSDEKLSITAAAADLGMSVPTLNRRLRAEGADWTNLLHERRMQKASRLLQESQRRISDIALAIGFSESASFTRSFAKYFGVTPSRYRKNWFKAD